MAAAAFAHPSKRKGRRDRMRLYPRERPGHVVRLLAGRLHAQLQLLPYRHAKTGAQPHRARDYRPDHGRAASAWRFSGVGAADRRPRANRRRRARGLEHRVHGHGRAALQSRKCDVRRRRDGRWRRAVGLEAPHHRLDLRRRAANRAARGRMRADAGDFAARGARRASR